MDLLYLLRLFLDLLLQELATLCILHLRLPCVVLLRMLHWILQVKILE